MYSLPSASHMREPLPRTIYGGSPPTDLNARTGESTPPGITREARAWSSCDLFLGFIRSLNIPQRKRSTTKDTKRRKGQIKQTSPDGTGSREKASREKASGRKTI